jgi:hypothetical protein
MVPIRAERGHMMKLKSFLKIGLLAAMAAAAITFVSGHAWAQGAQRLPLEKAS